MATETLKLKFQIDINHVVPSGEAQAIGDHVFPGYRAIIHAHDGDGTKVATVGTEVTENTARLRRFVAEGIKGIIREHLR